MAKVNGKKEIANKEVINEIEQEINRINQ